MSGGTAVKTADSGGGSPVLHKRSAEGRGNRWLCQRLGLDGGRGREAPREKKDQPAKAGNSTLRKGWKPNGRDSDGGSVHDSLVRRDAPSKTQGLFGVMIQGSIANVAFALLQTSRISSCDHSEFDSGHTKLDPDQSSNISIMKQQGGGHLLISYNTELLRDVCFHNSTAVEYLGKEAATSLQARHSDIQAASNVFELLVGKVSIDGNLCTLTVPDFLSIVMAPNYGTADGGGLYDWSTVGRIKLMRINDVE